MKIAIIGSGIAGICMARALANLAKNNFTSQILKNKENNLNKIANITIFERANSLDQALTSSASGNPVGILHPIISKHDFAREWTDQGINTTVRWIKELEIDNQFYNLCGVLHLPRNKKQEFDWLNSQNYQNLISNFVTKENLIKQFKYLNPVSSAVWSSHCGWVDPKEFIKAALLETKRNLGKKLKIIFNANVQLEQLKTLHNQQPNNPLQCFDSVIVAAGPGSLDLIEQNTLQEEIGNDNTRKSGSNNQNLTYKKPVLELVNGQITGILPKDKNWGNYFKHKPVLCKSGYITPCINGYIFSGATYETVKKPHCIPTKKNRLENIKRLTNLITHNDFPSNFTNQQIFDRVSTRCVSKDRLPIIGLLNKKKPKIYALTALGSRGLSWGPLAAETLAKEILSINKKEEESFINENVLVSRFRIDN